MAKYAAQTSVPVDRTKAEIEKELSRFGATGFFSGWQNGVTKIGFVYEGSVYQFELSQSDNPQEDRANWRALLLAIKAKIVWVSTGKGTFASEFMAQLLLPNGQTVERYLLPQIEQAKDAGNLPKLLPM